MYLITWEDNADGTWLDDPDGFDSEKQAREHAAKYPARTGASVCIYRCDLIDTIEGVTDSSPVRPCPGCDGHECDSGCAYPGAVSRPDRQCK